MPAEWRSVKNNADALIFHTEICSERKQISMIADEKSPARISHRIYATSCSGMEKNAKIHILKIFA